MPKLSRKFTISVLVLVTALLVASCTGSQKGAPTIDAEIIQGVTERSFYSALSPSSGSALLISETTHSARLLKIKDGKILDQRPVSPDELRITSDQYALTVNGEPGIFESSKLSLEAVLSGKSTLANPTLDALCFAAPFGAASSKIGSSEFSDFRVSTESTGYLFSGYRNGAVEGVGGAALGSHNSGITEVKFGRPEFGSLSVYRAAPYQGNTGYLYSAFIIDAGVEDFGLKSATNLYCALSTRALAIDPEMIGPAFSGSGLVSTTLTANSIVQFAGTQAAEAPWNVYYIKPASLASIQNGYAQGPSGSNGSFSTYLGLSNFSFALPPTARVSKITATLMRRSYPMSSCAADGLIEQEVALYNSSSKFILSDNPVRGSAVPAAWTSQTYVLAEAAPNGPGLYPASLVNSPEFGVVIKYRHPSACPQAVLVDLVNLTVTYQQ